MPQKATINWRGVRQPSSASPFATHKLRLDCIGAALEGATQGGAALVLYSVAGSC